MVAIEFRLRSLPFEAQKPLHIRYKGIVLEKTYVADFVCFEKVIIEIKAQEKLTTRDEAQILNYLAATGFEVGVLANFGALGQLEFKRFVK